MPVRRLSEFIRALRGAGLRISPDEASQAMEAVALVVRTAHILMKIEELVVMAAELFPFLPHLLLKIIQSQRMEMRV